MGEARRAAVPRVWQAAELPPVLSLLDAVPDRRRAHHDKGTAAMTGNTARITPESQMVLALLRRDPAHEFSAEQLLTLTGLGKHRLDNAVIILRDEGLVSVVRGSVVLVTEGSPPAPA